LELRLELRVGQFLKRLEDRSVRGVDAFVSHAGPFRAEALVTPRIPASTTSGEQRSIGNQRCTIVQKASDAPALFASSIQTVAEIAHVDRRRTCNLTMVTGTVPCYAARSQADDRVREA